MEVIYFSKKRPERACPLLKAVGRRFPGKDVVVVSDMEEFRRKLAGKRGKETIAVIIATDEQTLIDIYFTRSLLSGVSSILVLPDDEKLTGALAFRIGADYTFPPDVGIAVIASTVKGILRNEGPESIPRRDLDGIRVETLHTCPPAGNGQMAANS